MAGSEPTIHESGRLARLGRRRRGFAEALRVVRAVGRRRRWRAAGLAVGTAGGLLGVAFG